MDGETSLFKSLSTVRCGWRNYEASESPGNPVISYVLALCQYTDSNSKRLRLGDNVKRMPSARLSRFRIIVPDLPSGFVPVRSFVQPFESQPKSLGV